MRLGGHVKRRIGGSVRGHIAQDPRCLPGSGFLGQASGSNHTSETVGPTNHLQVFVRSSQHHMKPYCPDGTLYSAPTVYPYPTLATSSRLPRPTHHLPAHTRTHHHVESQRNHVRQPTRPAPQQQHLRLHRLLRNMVGQSRSLQTLSTIQKKNSTVQQEDTSNTTTSQATRETQQSTTN